MGSMRLFVALALLVAAASAGSLRRKKAEDTARMYVSLARLAEKYDCHQEEANLVDTLKTIRKKNGEKLGAVNANCTAEKAALAAKLAEGKGVIYTNGNKTMERARQTLQRSKDEAERDFKETRVLHEGFVADGEAAQAKAEAHQQAYKKNHTAAKAGFEEGLLTGKTIRSNAREASANARQTAADDYAAAMKEAGEAQDNALKAAAERREQGRDACNATLASQTDALAKDRAMVAEIEGHVDRLAICKKNKAKATALKEEAQEAAVASVQLLLLEVQQGAFETATKAATEAAKTECQKAGAGLEAAAASLTSAVDVSGNVADMKRRLEEHMAANANQFKACLVNQEDKFGTAKANAERTFEEAKAAQVLSKSQAETRAEDALQAGLRKADGIESAANATWAAATTEWEVRSSNLAEKQLLLADAQRDQIGAMGNATNLKNSEVEKAIAKKEAAFAAAAANAAAQVGNVTAAANKMQAGVEASCVVERKAIADEAALVDKIETTLSSIKVVNTEEQAAKRTAQLKEERVKKDKQDEQAKKAQLKQAEQDEKDQKAKAAAKAEEERKASEKKKEEEEKARAVEEAKKKQEKLEEEAQKREKVAEEKAKKEAEKVAAAAEANIKQKEAEEAKKKTEIEKAKEEATKKAEQLEAAKKAEAEASAKEMVANAAVAKDKQTVAADTARFKEAERAENAASQVGDENGAAKAEVDAELANADLADATRTLSTAEHVQAEARDQEMQYKRVIEADEK
jgi:unconventional prefoldin RPB5 interactor 1